MFRDTIIKCKDSFLFYTNLLYHTLIAHRERQMKRFKNQNRAFNLYYPSSAQPSYPSSTCHFS